MNNLLHTLTHHVGAIIGEMHEMGFNLSLITFDHACFRAQTPDDYENLVHAFSHHADILYLHAHIAKRRITTLKLHSKLPVTVAGHTFTIEVIELVEPSPGRTHTRGWEHVEFCVIPTLSPAAFAQAHSKANLSLTKNQAAAHLRLPASGQKIFFNATSLEAKIRDEKAAKT